MGEALPAPIVATRRGLLGAMMMAPVAGAALALPGMTSLADIPFSRVLAANKTAIARFEALPDSLELVDPAAFEAEEERMLDAADALFDAEPESWADFVEWLDECLGRDNDRTMRHARRLLDNAGYSRRQSIT